MSRYLKAFQDVATQPNNFNLISDCCLVELIQDDEFTKKVKTDSGKTVNLILTGEAGARQRESLQSDKPTFARVLMVGQGYDNPDDPKHLLPVECAPGDPLLAGDIILAGSHAYKIFSVFGKIVSYGETKLALIRASEIQMRFRGEEGFNTFFERVNRSLETAIQPQDSG